MKEGGWADALNWLLLVGFISVLVYPCSGLSPLELPLVLLGLSPLGLSLFLVIPGFNPAQFTPAGAHPPGFLSISAGQPHLDVLEHVGVVADLAQLHDCVHQRLRAAFALPGTIQEVKNPH